jgi:tetratricopeptide (TPR) repeat protein
MQQGTIPVRAERKLNEAEAHFSCGEFREALRGAREALELHPGYISALFMIGECLGDRTRKAIPHFEAAVRIGHSMFQTPGTKDDAEWIAYIESMKLLAHRYAETGRIRDAVNLTIRIDHLGENSRGYQRVQVGWMLATENHGKAMEIILRREHDEDEPAMFTAFWTYAKALCLFHQKRLEEAQDQLRIGYTICPQFLHIALKRWVPNQADLPPSASAEAAYLLLRHAIQQTDFLVCGTFAIMNKYQTAS